MTFDDGALIDASVLVLTLELQINNTIRRWCLSQIASEFERWLCSDTHVERI